MKLIQRFFSNLDLMTLANGFQTGSNAPESSVRRVEKNHEEIVQEIIAKRKGVYKPQEKQMSPYAGERNLSRAKRKALKSKMKY